MAGVLLAGGVFGGTQPGLTLVDSTRTLRRAGCPWLGGVMCLASLLQRGEDLGDLYGAKESDLKGFMGTGVPWATHVHGWRHEAWGKELVGV